MFCMRSVMVSADPIATLILAAVAVVAGITFRDYGLGWDDYTHSQYGDLLLKLYGSGFAATRRLSFFNPSKHGGGARRQGAALRSIRDAPADRGRDRHSRTVRHLAAGAAHRRTGRGPDRA